MLTFVSSCHRRHFLWKPCATSSRFGPSVFPGSLSTLQFQLCLSSTLTGGGGGSSTITNRSAEAPPLDPSIWSLFDDNVPPVPSSAVAGAGQRPLSIASLSRPLPQSQQPEARRPTAAASAAAPNVSSSDRQGRESQQTRNDACPSDIRTTSAATSHVLQAKEQPPTSLRRDNEIPQPTPVALSRSLSTSKAEAKSPPPANPHQSPPSQRPTESAVDTTSAARAAPATNTTTTRLEPPPPPSSSRVGGSGGSIAFQQQQAPPPSVRGFRTPPEVLNMLIHYIPTFWVPIKQVYEMLPPEGKEMVMHDGASRNFVSFLKKYRFYFEQRTTHQHAEVRLRVDLVHGKRGVADSKYASGMTSSDMHKTFNRPQSTSTKENPPPSQATTSTTARDAVAATSSVGRATASDSSSGPSHFLRNPPRNSEGNLVAQLLTQVPLEWGALPAVLARITPVVLKHPSYNSRLGVVGLLEKYREYFQIVDGRVRVRPFFCAPNALDEWDATTSAMPEVFAKLKSQLPPPAETEDAREGSNIETNVLLDALTDEDKKLVRERCKSLPRFLRMHGKEVVVSSDNMRVRRFVAELEPCGDQLARRGNHAEGDVLKPNDPILQIPVEMVLPVRQKQHQQERGAHDLLDSDGGVAAGTSQGNSDWAVKELYDALPLMQACELDDLLQLIPSGVRLGLPQDHEEVTILLEQHPTYFSVWRYPDDAKRIIVQRAKLPTPEISREELMRAVLPLIPQGGVDAEALMRKVALPVQRYFYRHGLTKVCQGTLADCVLVHGTRVLRIA